MTPQEFLASELGATQAELGTAILNRTRWDKLREDRQLLLFLQERAERADFRGLRAELQGIADGQLKIPSLPGPRARASDCLLRWAEALNGWE